MSYAFRLLILSVFTLTIGCSIPQKDKKKSTSMEFYLGTYTHSESKGIYKYKLFPSGNLELIGLVAKVNNPSFLCFSADRHFLVSVNETDSLGTGFVESYLIEKDTLLLRNRQISGGAHPCYVSSFENIILTANYTGGNIALHQLNNEGYLSKLSDTVQHSGKGNHARQESAHAHCIVPDSVSGNIFVADLGTNSIYQYGLKNGMFEGKHHNPLNMKEKSGPRHISFHPNGKWVYVINELSNTVALVNRGDNDTLIIQSEWSTLPKNFSGQNTSADIHISSDGRFLYTSNRGHNSLAVFSVNTVTGYLQLVQHVSVSGKTPRNFAISPNQNFIIVANQDSDNLVCFLRDVSSGQLTQISEIEAPVPVFILFE